MKLGDLVTSKTRELSSGGIATAELDVLVLLEDLLNTNRAQLLARPELEVSSEQQKVLNSQIERRKSHEPLAYIRGKTEFYGREFVVNNHVLEPRPESETMIYLLKKLDVNTPIIADIGCGSGALGITAKLEIPDSQIFMCDVDDNCLDVAKQNAETHNTDAEIYKSDLLQIHKGVYTVLLCNLPYVPDDFHINLAATHEPKIAIFGGPDGLDLYRKLFEQIDSLKIKPNYILTESLPTQHQELQKIAKQHNYKLEHIEDFILVFKKSS